MTTTPVNPTGHQTMDKMARRLDAPAYHRNIEPILGVLKKALTAQSGDAIEIGSGSGQHITAFARSFPAITWWPSDPEPAHRDSIMAWGRLAQLPNLMSPIGIDASQTDWYLGTDQSRPPSKLTAIVCCNVFHIAPWPVTRGVLAGAGKHLMQDGLLLTYGPYKRNGRHTAPSNAAFDASLRARNPNWGVRDITDIEACARKAGLNLAQTVEMPANNLMLIFAHDTS